MRVIIGYDGSQCAEQAIIDLERAGLLPDETEALVFAAWDSYVPPEFLNPDASAPESSVVLLRDVQRLRTMARESLALTRERAERHAALMRMLYPGWAIQVEVRAVSPHWGLISMAEEWRADLIVVGSNGRSALGRFFLGSVSQQVLHNASCSVRIGRCSPSSAKRQGCVRLVLGFDGSKDSKEAITAIAARHWPAETEALVIGVVDGETYLNHLLLDQEDAQPDSDPDTPHNLNDALYAAREELESAGLSATCRLMIGDPKKILVEEAQRVEADCIIVGALGHTRLERFLLGSVSASVAARASCSVEVIRRR